MRPGYCPIGGEPCQSVCADPCTAKPKEHDALNTLWQAARAAALEEAAEIADAHATCEGIAQRIAADIRALREK